ncbi:dihydrofolate reductase family protein [Marisediminicola sp. LYQ134]|uniref:dihydrofolate reductase family protein n=1 Tax=Marisediminicola sp. LYQ134 TaxID=3391061 RepID=UPI0039836CAC
MSATLTVDFFCSLDGYGSAEGWPGYWGKEGLELVADRVKTFAHDQVLVFGATTFREFSEFVTEFDEPYFDRLTELPKIVFSSTLDERSPGWQNSTVIAEDAVGAIERLKRTTDVPMRSHGSITLNRALLAAGLVDRLEVILFPAVTGRAGYASLFHGGAEFDLDLIESSVFDARTIKLVYAPTLHGAIPEGVGPQPRDRGSALDGAPSLG